MKLSVSLPVVLAQISSSSQVTQSNRINRLWDEAIDQYKSLYQGYFGLNSTNHRRIMEEVDSIYNLDRVNNYGCWCHFGQDSRSSPFRGHTMDKLDRICKRFHESTTCLHIDNEFCDYESIEYNSMLADKSLSNMPFDNKVDYKQFCNEANPLDFSDPASHCKQIACEVDASFLRDLYIFMSTNFVKESYSAFKKGKNPKHI